MPAHVEAFRPKLAHWADLLGSSRANTFTEQEILPDFLTDFFCELLGYTRPADGGPCYTISREKHVEVDGKFADAVLGDFGRGADKFIVALEGKEPKDPLDRPFAGRRMSAVDQGYRYAINPNYSSDLPRWLGLAARGAFAELEMTWEGGDRRTPPFPHDQTCGGGGGTLDCREDHPGSGCAAGARARTASAT